MNTAVSVCAPNVWSLSPPSQAIQFLHAQNLNSGMA